MPVNNFLFNLLFYFVIAGVVSVAAFLFLSSPQIAPFLPFSLTREVISPLAEDSKKLAGMEPSFYLDFKNHLGKVEESQINIDFGAFQKRVAGECSSGSAIRIIDEEGEVTCQQVGGGGGTTVINNTAGVSSLTGGGGVTVNGTSGTPKTGALVLGTSGIPYSSLNLSGSIVNADISGFASIAYSKLNLGNSLLSSDILDGTIANSDISAAAGIAYSKLNLTGSIIGGDLASNLSISTTGNLTTSGSGTITSAGLLSALNGFTLSGGTLTLPSTSVSDSYLTSNVALLNAGQTFSALKTFSAGLTVSGGTLTLPSGSITGGFILDGTITGSDLSGSIVISTSGNIATTGSLTFGTTFSSSCAGLSGYIWVPGNPKFGTMPGFCVMKYEAKDDGAGNAVSTATGTPWVSISQQTAEDKARAACSGCHLLTEAEWMTIAYDALWVNANWCDSNGGACGNAPGTAGKILAAGHNDNSPAAALAASSTDSEACFGTVTAGVNTACGSAGTQKRTLTLSTGSVIWDLPGNVWEWTNSTIIGNEEPNDAVDGFAWHEFTAITKWKALNYANPTNRSWNSTQGLGQIFTDGTSTNTTLYAFIRGGDWYDGANAGAFTLNLNPTPTLTYTIFGFRVAR